MHWENTDYNYYEGYLLEDTIQIWELTSKQEDLLHAAIYIVDNKVTIRQTSKEFMVAKSTLHARIQRDLPKISYELYTLVCKQLKLNKQKYFR